MRFKGTTSRNTTGSLIAALGSDELRDACVQHVSVGCFGAADAEQRSAYYLQSPDLMAVGKDAGNRVGLEFRLTGVSRGNRPPQLFHMALEMLIAIISRTAIEALVADESDQEVHLSVVMMLDGEIWLPEGGYGSIVEKHDMRICRSMLMPELPEYLV